MKVGKTFYAPNRAAWRSWLAKHHKTAPEIFLIYYKKDSGKPRVPYNHAVEEALCYGWIDSILKPIDDKKYVQRYSPRRRTSVLSAMNLERVRRLIKAGRMTKAGLASIAHAFDERKHTKAKLPAEVPKDIVARLKTRCRRVEELPTFSGVVPTDPHRVDRGRAPPARGVRAAAQVLSQDDGQEQALWDGAVATSAART